eukprot:1046541-Rhodomonas_salina.1
MKCAECRSKIETRKKVSKSLTPIKTDRAHTDCALVKSALRAVKHRAAQWSNLAPFNDAQDLLDAVCRPLLEGFARALPIVGVFERVQTYPLPPIPGVFACVR